jgi:2-polyprenyl-3-methyl-5-hydroxy-6-metoxy-1,4-benzoquinol methylase
MHYQINDVIIRSENAAKSPKQQSKEILEWLKSQDKIKRAIDYGCGKLRYSKELGEKCEELFVLDSKIQLERTQVIFDEKTNIIDYVKSNMSNTKVMPVENLGGLKVKFDIVLCANVLSAIPKTKDRDNVAKNIHSLMKEDGKALFVTQYYDTYFTKALSDPNNIKYNDGWINKDYNSFYGIINPEQLEALIIKANFKIKKKWKASKSIFIEAGKK